MPLIDPLYVTSGFAVGLLVGMTGVGGGSLMTPLLILLFGIHPSTAVGTDLLYAAATKTGGSLVHGWSQSIHWPAVMRLASGSIPASVVTLLVLWQLELNGEAARSLVNVVLCPLPGIVIGSYCAVRVPETVLRLLLATVLILVAGKLGFNELHLSTASIAAVTGSVAH